MEKEAETSAPLILKKTHIAPQLIAFLTEILENSPVREGRKQGRPRKFAADLPTEKKTASKRGKPSLKPPSSPPARVRSPRVRSQSLTKRTKE